MGRGAVQPPQRGPLCVCLRGRQEISHRSVHRIYISADSVGSVVSSTVEPLYKGQVGDGSFVPWREVVLFSEVTNVLSLCEVEIGVLQLVLCSEVFLFRNVHYQRLR